MREFREFYDSSRPGLLRALAVVTTDAADAEDVLQEAFSAASQRWDRVSRLENPGAWVRRVAINRAVDLHRRSARQRGAYERLPRTVEALDDISLEVQQAVRQLPMDERVVVVLHHLVGLTVSEIAAEIGRPSGTVKAQLVRGRQRLADSLRLPAEENR